MTSTLAPRRAPDRRAARQANAAAEESLRTPARTAYLFLLPYLALFGVFVLAPVVWGIWISLHEWDFLLPGKPFVGLDNYAELFDPSSTTSEPFWSGMKATAIFVVLSVPLLVGLALVLAVGLNGRFAGRNFFRAMFFAPYVLGVAVVGLLWRYLLDPNVGVINYYLGALGIEANFPWTTQLPWVWAALVVPTLWWTVGYNTVIFLAGLQDIPAELYEAAAIDGAGWWQQFLNVTVPGLRHVMVFVVTITILASANVFGQPYIITQGQPGEETRTAIMEITELGLQQFDMGSASAMSTVLT
ncbi:MAG TPA: sugar ABC transporter permease, partial [Nocardioidaceae bacterium]|nr:sugar ABC transporter permease [Nocardioidaceae bacterium]